MLAYPSVTTPNLYSDPSLWSVSHCSNLERTSGKAAALSTVSFQTEREGKNGSEVKFNYHKSPEKDIHLQGSWTSVYCERCNVHYFASVEQRKKSEPSTRFKPRPPRPDTSRALLTRVLHTTGISVSCGDKYSGLRERVPHCKIDTLDNMKILLLQWVNAILKIGRGDRGR